MAVNGITNNHNHNNNNNNNNNNHFTMSRPRAASFNLPPPSSNSYFSKAPTFGIPASSPEMMPRSRHASIDSPTGSFGAISPTAPSFQQPSPVSSSAWLDLPAIDTYYQLVHPTLPVLPPSRVQLRARLEASPEVPMRHAVLNAVSLLVDQRPDYTEQMVSVLSALVPSTTTSSNTSSVLSLTTLILLYLRSRTAACLGAAVSLAYDMQLHVTPTSDSPLSMDCRRLFLILVLLDRFNNSVRRHMPMLIPDEYVRLNPEVDAACFFGSRAQVEMVRLCMARSIGELDGIGRSIEGLWDTAPMLKAVYFFARINLNRSSHPSPSDASSLSFLLDSPLVSVSPLVRYFVPVLADRLCISGDPEITRVVQFMNQLIARKYPEFEYLLDGLKKTIGGSHGLDGLADAAHRMAEGR
jgi:hypothetical protein